MEAISLYCLTSKFPYLGISSLIISSDIIKNIGMFPPRTNQYTLKIMDFN
jgi:hypothetical protein